MTTDELVEALALRLGYTRNGEKADWIRETVTAATQPLARERDAVNQLCFETSEQLREARATITALTQENKKLKDEKK